MAVNLGEDGTLEKLGANTFYNILESSGGSSAGGAGVNDINDGLATTTLRAPNKLVNGNGGGGGGDMCIPGWTPSKELQADPAWPLGGGGIWNNRKAEFANHNFSYFFNIFQYLNPELSLGLRCWAAAATTPRGSPYPTTEAAAAGLPRETGPSPPCPGAPRQ